jgi:hypothetical protein
VFIGLVELKGSAECEVPLTSFLAERECVQFSYSIEERWSRTVTETVTDKDGHSHTTTRTESGWTSVGSGGDCLDFYLKDDTGLVLIRPKGAKLTPLRVFSETVGWGDPLYYAKAQVAAVSNSDHVRRFVEVAIPLHAPIYVVGKARERADLVAPEIAEAKDASMFLISTETEEQVQRGFSAGSWVFWSLGLIAFGAGAVVPTYETPMMIPALGAALGLYLAFWGLGWVWMVYNSLVGLRERVRQGWSLVDVELKRRADLIPLLVETVSGLSGHEKTVQTSIAALRAQSQATAPGVSGPDFDGLVPSLRAVIEAYPTLTAQESFVRLHGELVTTEQRIALARTYYNDIATQYATRLERVPDSWVAKLGGMKREALLNAENFERAAVKVELAGD